MSKILWPPTTGFEASAVTLMTSEISGLANNANAVSSVGGSSGVFTGFTSYSRCLFADIMFTPGASWTPATPFVMFGWFILSLDGGTNYEASDATPARAPDFVIPLISGAGTRRQIANRPVLLPSGHHKIMVRNQGGASTPSSSTLTLRPFTEYAE